MYTLSGSTTPMEKGVTHGRDSPISATSSSSLAQWRQARDQASASSSPRQHSPTNRQTPSLNVHHEQAPSVHSEKSSGDQSQRRNAHPTAAHGAGEYHTHLPKKLTNTEEAEEEENGAADARNANPRAPVSRTPSFSQVEEQSYRGRTPSAHPEDSSSSPNAANYHHAHVPIKTAPQVIGDEYVRWSMSSTSSLTGGGGRGASPLQQQHRDPRPALNTTTNTTSTAQAIAASVPKIAHERASAVASVSSQWTAELQHRTAPEEEARRAYQQLEVELDEARKRLGTVEKNATRARAEMQRLLEGEREGRLKAEQDREELLTLVSTSSAFTPGVLITDPNGPASTSGSPGAGASTTSASGAFYDKMREREERARAQVRKEFVRQAQENVYAETKKTVEAEKSAEDATRRLRKVEEDLRNSEEALRDSTEVVEAKEVQLHERAIHIQELEGRLRLLEMQLASAKESTTQVDQQARSRLEEAQALADMRLRELEDQRHFAAQLHEQLGSTTRDLQDRESSQESILNLVNALQSKCTRLENDLAAAVAEATNLLEQKRLQAEQEAALLVKRNAELQRRCSTMETELMDLKGRREYDANEVSRLRERYEKQLSDQSIEVRSLQLQLDQLTESTQRHSSELTSFAALERQQQGSLLRQYAAEATAAREELDRNRALMQRENEKHLKTILDLSQQLTALKQANTRLEHLVNVRDHEGADATRLLTQAREELLQMREERRRLSASLVDFREDSRVRYVADSQDAVHRRVAELELVRRDLGQKLMEANNTIADLQLRAQYLIEYPATASRSASNGQQREQQQQMAPSRRSSVGSSVAVTASSFIQLAADRRASGGPGGRRGEEYEAEHAFPRSNEGMRGITAAPMPNTQRRDAPQTAFVSSSSLTGDGQEMEPKAYHPETSSSSYRGGAPSKAQTSPRLEVQDASDGSTSRKSQTQRADSGALHVQKHGGRCMMENSSPDAASENGVTAPLPLRQDPLNRPRRSAEPTTASGIDDEEVVVARTKGVQERLPARLPERRVVSAKTAVERPLSAASNESTPSPTGGVAVVVPPEESVYSAPRDELETDQSWDSQDSEPPVMEPSRVALPSRDATPLWSPEHAEAARAMPKDRAQPFTACALTESAQDTAAWTTSGKSSAGATVSPSVREVLGVVKSPVNAQLSKDVQPNTSTLAHEPADSLHRDGIISFSRVPLATPTALVAQPPPSASITSPDPRKQSLNAHHHANNSSKGTTTTTTTVKVSLFGNVHLGGQRSTETLHTQPPSSDLVHSQRTFISGPADGSLIIDVHRSTPPRTRRRAPLM